MSCQDGCLSCIDFTIDFKHMQELVSISYGNQSYVSPCINLCINISMPELLYQNEVVGSCYIKNGNKIFVKRVALSKSGNKSLKFE